MIDLYAYGTANGIRARIAIEECALPYTLHLVDLGKGEQKSPSFLALNPNGQIPVIVDSDGPGGKPATLSQSLAILIYCAEKSGRFLPGDPASRPLFLQALASAATDMGGTLGALVAVSRLKEPNAAALELFKSSWSRYLKVWDEALARRRYCAGEEITIADFALYSVYARMKGTRPELCEGFPGAARWAAELSARPAIQRAMKF